MKKISSIVFVMLIATSLLKAQQNYYDVTAADGYGVRFWQNDLFKIHMGNSSEYHYGPVYDYSIKTNMNSDAGRGWTWGLSGSTPIAAISNTGHMQIAGNFYNNGIIGVNGVPVINTGNNPNDIYINDRVIRNESTGYPDGMYINFNSSGSTDAHLRFFANGTTERMRIDASNGNVGIGTTAPSSWFGGKALEIQDTRPVLKLNNTGGLSTIMFTNTNVNTSTRVGEFHFNYMYDTNPIMSRLAFYSYPAGENLSILASGNVGIGTSTPDQKLSVNGTIHSKEVKVDLTGWPDYVFRKNYKLTPLADIKNYIDENEHLPEMPSAREVETNGAYLGEMNKLLLKKVEELTLYAIEAKGEIELLKAEVKELKKK